VALVASFGVRAAAPTAHAEVTSTTAIYCAYLAGVIDGDADDTTVGADVTAACDGLSAADIALIADAVGDEDGTLEAGELDDLDLDANQITESSVATGALDEIYLIALVNDDGTTTFDAETGADISVNLDTTGGPSADADANVETCAGVDDLDCDAAILDDGDGVVVATAISSTADEGDSVDVDIEQESVGESQTLNVVGSADDVALTLVETTIQSDADSDCADGTLEVTDSDALSNPDSTIAIAAITDNDGRNLTRIGTAFSSSDDDVATPGDFTSLSVDGGDSGIAAFAVICGDDNTGTADITADIGVDDDTQEITVVGAPANVALTASPAQIACDGSQTSTVTATVTDSEGNNVANGVGVTFSVVALGTANPINTTTTDGTSSSTITPLSGATAGVTVIVSAGSASSSIRVDCSLPIPPTTNPNATPTRPGGISGPDTGNGGYLGQDSSAGFPMWTLVALALGSVVLVAGGLVTRRAGR